MCKGNNTTTSTTAPNAQAMAAYQGLLGKAQDVAQTPFTPYSGEFVAPVNAQQTTGINNINQNANYAQPYIQQAAGYANQAAQPITAGQIAGYQSPYTQQVVDATQRQFNNANAQQQQQVVGNAAAQGALGGDRVGVAQANLAGQQRQAQDPVIAGLYNSGYQNAEQMALSQQSNLGNAAYSLGNLGVAGQGAALSGAGAQVGAGTLQQGTQQQQDAALYSQFQQQQAYPFQTAQWLAGIDTGLGSQMGGTSTTTPPPPNPWSQVAGLGIAAAGAFAKDGGRIRGFDTGGGVGGVPYAGVQGYVPTMNITGGGGAPKPPGTPQAASQGQQAGLGNIKGEMAAFKGAKNLWNQYGGSGSSPMDIGSGGFSPDGMGSMQAIGSAPEAGFGFGALYRRGGAVEPQYRDRITVPRRHFDEGGPVTMAGFGAGSMMPDSFDDRFYVPSPPSDPKKYNLLQDYGASQPDAFEGRGMPAGHIAEIPTPRPRPGLSNDDMPELPREITQGSSRPVAGLGADTGSSDAMAFADDRRAPIAGVAEQPRDQETPATTDEQPRDAETARSGLFGLNLSPETRQGLLAAGLGMMASRSPFLGQAIGEGGLQGLSTYSGAQKATREEAKSKADIEHGRKQLEQHAKEAADRLAQDTRKLESTEAHQNAVLDEQQKQHRMALKAPVTLGSDPRTGMPILAVPRLNKSGDIDYHLIGPNGQISDTPIGQAATPGPQSEASPANAPIRTAALETGSVSDAPKPGEGIIQHNQRLAQSGAFDYGTDAPYIEKGLDVPEPAPLAGRSVQALKTDAEYYLQTSKLPPVVRGNSPVALVQQKYQNAVKNYAGALAQSRGMKPDEVAEAWRTAPGMLRFVLGADGRSTVSLGTAVRHLDTIKQLADAWKEGSTIGNWQTWNRVTSSVRREFGDQSVSNLESAARIVGPEIIKALGVAGAGTEHDRNTAASQFLTGQGVDQINGAIKTTQSLLGGQLEGRKRQATNAGVSEERFKSLIGDRPYEILSHMDKGEPAGGTASQSLPTVKSKAEFDALRPGSKFIDQNGKQWSKP